MKKVILFAFAALLALAALSCKKDEKKPVSADAAGEYSGVLTCTVAGTEYPNEGIGVSVSEDAGKLVFTLREVKFVPQMPVTMTFSIGPVDGTVDSEGVIRFSSSDVLIPYTEAARYESYAVSGFSGSVAGNTLRFSMTFATPMGPAPTSYEGVEQPQDGIVGI